MSEDVSARIATPPYVSYRTFTTFLESMRQAIPNRLDKSAFPTMSGGTYNQLMPALRYLKLVDANDRPTDALIELTNLADPEARRKEWAEILRGAYHYILDDADFNLESITPRQLSDRFRENGAAGDTVRKCERFFISAAQDAGIRLGPFLLASARSTEKKFVQQERAARPRRLKGSSKRRMTDGGTTPEAPSGLVLKELIAKLPNFDPTWPKETQANYLAFTEKVMRFAKQQETGDLFAPDEQEEDTE